MKRKRVIVAVTNDLYTDQRVDKICRYLTENGAEVLLVGRKLKTSKEITGRNYKTHRMSLKFTKGAWFYAEYNIRLAFFLLRQKFDFLVSNDLDTLPACDFASSCKGKEVVYDSHECFTEVPELLHKPVVRKIWEVFEIMIFRNLQRMYTVNLSIASWYNLKYKKVFRIVANLPENTRVEKTKTKVDLELPADKKILILQGAGINIQRGAEELCEAMGYLDNCYLVIVGSGDVFPMIKEKINKDPVLSARIKLVDKLPYQEMMQYTLNADLGFSLDKPVSLNYTFSLPNKLFDYIRAGLPVMVTDLPEVKRVVEEFNVGKIVHDISPLNLSEEIRKMLKNEEEMKMYRRNCAEAMNALNWDNQKKVLDEIYKGLV